MDQGFIRSLKAKYRKNVDWKIIQSVEKKKTLPKISLLQGMQMLVSAWDALSTRTIVNCFRKPRISTKSQETTIVEDDDPIRELQDKIDDLRSAQPNVIKKTLIPLPLQMLMLKLKLCNLHLLMLKF